MSRRKQRPAAPPVAPGAPIAPEMVDRDGDELDALIESSMAGYLATLGAMLPTPAEYDALLMAALEDIPYHEARAKTQRPKEAPEPPSAPSPRAGLRLV